METSHQPFRRVTAFVAAITALISSGMSMNAALSQKGPYTSRGKGLGKHSGKGRGNWSTLFDCNRSGSDLDHNGERECARRMRQMAKGQLSFIEFKRKPILEQEAA